MLVAPHLGAPMAVYPWLGLGLCRAMLCWQRMDLADLHFRWRDLGSRPLPVGGGLGTAYDALNFMAIGPALAWLLDDRPDLSFRRRAALARRLRPGARAGLAVGGFCEELVFRGFLRAMLQRHLARSPRAPHWPW